MDHSDRIDLIVRSLTPDTALQVFLAGRDRSGRLLRPSRIAAVERELTGVFGGSTTIRATGIWRNGAGRLVREPVLIVEVHPTAPLSHVDRHSLRSCLSRILTDLNQEVLAAVVKTTGRMRLVPRTGSSDTRPELLTTSAEEATQ